MKRFKGPVPPIISSPLLALILFLPGRSLGDEIYTWKDRDGVVHFVDQINLVPPEYRKEAEKRAKERGMVEEGGTYNIIPAERGTAAYPPPPREGGEGVEPPPQVGGRESPRTGKEFWHNKIRTWKETLEKSKTDLENAYNSRLFLLTRTPPDFHTQLHNVNLEIENLKERIAEAERMLKEVIPEEARRSGVPPGWLREAMAE